MDKYTWAINYFTQHILGLFHFYMLLLYHFHSSCWILSWIQSYMRTDYHSFEEHCAIILEGKAEIDFVKGLFWSSLEIEILREETMLAIKQWYKRWNFIFTYRLHWLSFRTRCFGMLRSILGFMQRVSGYSYILLLLNYIIVVVTHTSLLW